MTQINYTKINYYKMKRSLHLMMEGGHKINFILNQKAIFCMGQAKTLWADHSDPLTFKKVNKSWR